MRRLYSSSPLSAGRHFGRYIIGIMASHSVTAARVALGIIFLWFGLIKFLPLAAPIDLLAEKTLVMLTFHLFRPETCLHVLAAGECLIGLGLLTNRFIPLTLFVLLLQMLGTFSPLVLLHRETWIHFPYLPSFEGQYIIKNIALIACGLVVGSMSRGGKIIANPTVAARAVQVEIAIEERALVQLETSAGVTSTQRTEESVQREP